MRVSILFRTMATHQERLTIHHVGEIVGVGALIHGRFTQRNRSISNLTLRRDVASVWRLTARAFILHLSSPAHPHTATLPRQT